MDWDHVVQRLEQVLGVPFRWETLDKWEGSGTSWQIEDTVYFKPEGQSGKRIRALATDAAQLTDKERKLVEMIVRSDEVAHDRKPLEPVTNEETRARRFGEYLAAKLEEGDLQGTLQDEPFLRSFQFHDCLALLLDADFAEPNRFTYKELKKLLETYFESETVLIPLSEREWIVLASGAVLHAANEDGDYGESEEELLESIAFALHEMIVEWLGDCRVSTSGMIHAPANLLTATAAMRSAIKLGRLFHGEESVHLPWQLHLERLLYSMDDREKRKFLEQLMKNAEHTALDAEMITTLQAFFQNDCNISETSKALYIHRNTLLYRLDKFKQATGMDVRKFHDAVLVHMALLLYKVTKRD